MAKAAMIAPMAKLAAGASQATGIGGLLPTLLGGGAKSLSPLASLLSGGKAGVPAAGQMAAAGAPSALTKPPIPAPIPLMPMMDQGMDQIRKKFVADNKPKNFWDSLDKNKMREAGLGLMQAGMQQQQQQTPLQLAPFQPQAGGGGGGQIPQPQLMSLLQQLGLNKVL